MVNSEKKSIKLSLKLGKGSQTISGCNPNATDAQFYALAQAVTTLESTKVEGVSKIEEYTLTDDGQ